MRTFAILGFSFISLSAFAQNTFGDIIGTYQDKTDKSGIPGALVYTSSGSAVYKTTTEDDGRFRLSAVPPGTYQVFFVSDNDTITAPNEVEVAPDGMGDLGVVYNAQTLDAFVLKVDREELKLTRGVAPEIKLSGKNIRQMPVKFDTKLLVTSMTSDVRMTADGDLVFRGARAGDAITYLDGVKMNDVPRVPSAGIGYMMVYSGAIPAKYGDTNGGVVVIETLSYTDMWKEWKRTTGQ